MGDSNYVSPEGLRIGDRCDKVKLLGKLKHYDSQMSEYELPSKWTVILEKIDTVKTNSLLYKENNPCDMKIITFGKYSE
jgi:hypothetical protein